MQKPRSAAKKITETYLQNAGLYYLGRFSASTGQFRKVMRQKITRSCRDHPDQDPEACYALLEKTIVYFQNLGYLNDDVYARGMVSSLRQRGLSRRVILNRLGMKGLDQDKITQILSEHDERDNDDDAEITAALTLARKRKLGPYSGANVMDQQKALNIFARAGFSYEIAQKILKMRADDPG